MTSSSRQALAIRTANVWSSSVNVRLVKLAGVGLVAVGFGLLASRGLGFIVIGLCLAGAAVIWVAPRPVALSAVVAVVAILPTPAMAHQRVHGISLPTTLAVVTLCAALALWRDRRASGARPTLSSYAVGALLVVIVASITQLGISHYAALKPIYQLSPVWLAGLLLGSLLASDRRMLDGLGLLAVPLSLFAVVEFVVEKPNLWSKVVGANLYAELSEVGGNLRATSTFGHPLVAGAALVVLAFFVLVQPGRRSAILFPIIVAGAVVTVSRSALVGLAAGLLAHFASSEHRRVALIGATVATVAAVWLMLALIPTLGSSFDARVLHASTQNQAIRLNSYHSLAESFSQGSPELITGRGLEGSLAYLARTGGNLGFVTYDNQYISSLYDSGLLVVLLVVGLIFIGVSRAKPGWRTLAPLVASAATLFFFEGLYWPVTGLLFWMAVGLATAPRRQSGQAESRASSATGRAVSDRSAVADLGRKAMGSTR